MIAPSRGNPGFHAARGKALLAAALVAAGCAGAGPDPAAAKAPERAPIAPSYAALFGFREAHLRQGKGATEPFTPGDDVREATFNAHLRAAPALSSSRPLLVATPEARGEQRAAALDLADRWVDALRALGIDARRDAVGGEPALLEAPLVKAGAAQVRLRFSTLALGEAPLSFDAVIALRGGRGGEGEIRCQGQALERPPDALGWASAALASCLLGDPRGRSLLGGAP